MAEDDDVKGKVVRLLATARPARKKVRAVVPGEQLRQIAGDSSVQVGLVGRDLNINTRHVTRTTVAPPPGSLSPAQAKRLKDMIDKLVRIEATGGVLGGELSPLYAKWHKILKDRFDVTSYKEIKAARADEALAWLRQVAAMNRPKLRRTDPAAWRNEHYRAIWARARETGRSKGDVYALVLARLDKQVVSLKQLSDANLRRLYEVVMAR